MNKFELKSIRAKVENENEVVEAVLIHEIKDEFHDGDVVLFNYAIDEFENDADVEYAINNSHVESCFKYDEEKNLYFIGDEA